MWKSPMKIVHLLALFLCASSFALAQVPPTIDVQPSSLTVTQSSSAAFAVAASGDSPLSYFWRKSGNVITGATASTYLISSATAADAGDYTVIVSNSVNSVTSSVATLTVLLPVTIT